MSDKKEYVVIKPHTKGHDIGAVLNLTDTEAANLVNKIRPKDEAESKAGRKSKIEQENLTLKHFVSELNKDIDEGQAIIAQLVATNPQLGDVVKQLIATNAEKRAAEKAEKAE